MESWVLLMMLTRGSETVPVRVPMGGYERCMEVGHHPETLASKLEDVKLTGLASRVRSGCRLFMSMRPGFLLVERTIALAVKAEPVGGPKLPTGISTSLLIGTRSASRARPGFFAAVPVGLAQSLSRLPPQVFGVGQKGETKHYKSPLRGRRSASIATSRRSHTPN